MKTIYTLTLTFILLLAGCVNDYNGAVSISAAFLRDCKTGTIQTQITNDGTTKTLTINCSKP